jgi:large subunit ribosomal protein L30e
MTMDAIAEIKSLLDHKRTIIGKERTLKALRGKHLERVFVSANASPALKEDITHAAALTGTTVVDLTQKSDELGAICRKPFAIQALGATKPSDE